MGGWGGLCIPWCCRDTLQTPWQAVFPQWVVSIGCAVRHSESVSCTSCHNRLPVVVPSCWQQLTQDGWTPRKHTNKLWFTHPSIPRNVSSEVGGDCVKLTVYLWMACFHMCPEDSAGWSGPLTAPKKSELRLSAGGTSSLERVASNRKRI